MIVLVYQLGKESFVEDNVIEMQQPTEPTFADKMDEAERRIEAIYAPLLNK